MVNRVLFSSLCKTFLAACFVAAIAFPSHAQIVAEAPAQPAIARVSFGAPAEKLKVAGVPRAGRISDVLFRGAQPSAQGLAELKKLGITTIVNLRGNSGPVASERREVESLGMRFIDIPVLGWSAPTNAQVAQFLKLFRDDPQQKVFVHCYYGEDRSGVMVAAYRIAQQNWTADQAVAEMYSFGFHYHLYPGMKSYVREFPGQFATNPIFAALHGLPAQR
ncbi:MAG TPA: dual specificity protein phosphatase family protein [Candidatus Acidoferrum sp.]